MRWSLPERKQGTPVPRAVVPLFYSARRRGVCRARCEGQRRGGSLPPEFPRVCALPVDAEPGHGVECRARGKAPTRHDFCQAGGTQRVRARGAAVSSAADGEFVSSAELINTHVGFKGYRLCNKYWQIVIRAWPRIGIHVIWLNFVGLFCNFLTKRRSLLPKVT